MSLKKSTIDGWKKDTKSGVLVNTDLRDYKALVAQREEAKAKTDIMKRLQLLEERYIKLDTMIRMLVPGANK